MELLDVTTYIVHRSAALAMCIATFILIGGAFTAFCFEECSKKAGIVAIFTVAASLLITCSLILMPSHKRILKVKVERIINEAVNKQNITKGVETLERIAKNLECKYLGCEGEKDVKD